MTAYKLLVVLMVGLVALPSYAGIGYFSCTTTAGKQIAIDYIGNNIVYRYGKKGNPEITLKNGYEGDSYDGRQWVFKNGQYSYIVYGNSIPAYDEYGEIYDVDYVGGGVRVYRSGRLINTQICRPNTLSIGNG